MFDVAALEAAGFAKKFTQAEWRDYQAKMSQHYLRTDGPTAQPVPGGKVTVNYVLESDDVVISTEQNTQQQAPFGIQMTVEYPEVAIIEHKPTGRRVSCDSSNTQLILALVADVAKPPAR